MKKILLYVAVLALVIVSSVVSAEPLSCSAEDSAQYSMQFEVAGGVVGAEPMTCEDCPDCSYGSNCCGCEEQNCTCEVRSCYPAIYTHCLQWGETYDGWGLDSSGRCRDLYFTCGAGGDVCSDWDPDCEPVN